VSHEFYHHISIKMSSKKEYELKGWADLCKDGFTMSFTEGGNDWSKRVTKNNEIRIIIDSHKYKYKSADGFSLRKIMGLINDTYFRYCDKYYDGDYDQISNISLTGFKIDNDCNVYPEYST